MSEFLICKKITHVINDCSDNFETLSGGELSVVGNVQAVLAIPLRVEFLDASLSNLGQHYKQLCIWRARFRNHPNCDGQLLRSEIPNTSLGCPGRYNKQLCVWEARCRKRTGCVGEAPRVNSPMCCIYTILKHFVNTTQVVLKESV